MGFCCSTRVQLTCRQPEFCCFMVPQQALRGRTSTRLGEAWGSTRSAQPLDQNIFQFRSRALHECGNNTNNQGFLYPWDWVAKIN